MEGSGAEWWGKGNLQELLYQATTIVTFNGKFDLQWIVKEGLTYDARKVWDCQLAHFIQTHQTSSYPSLNDVAQYHDLPTKLDVVKTEYWDKGIDTDAIPEEVLFPYAAHDAWLTLQIYNKQRATIQKAQKILCQLQSQDMSILREMEANGIPFDEEMCQARSLELDEQIKAANQKLQALYPKVPINFNSTDHVSAFLYGGVVKEDSKEFIGYYKSGIKKGEPKYQNIVIEHQLPRLYQPIKGSELAKDGLFSTNEGTLRKLKGKKDVVKSLLDLAKMEKLNGTYYKGLVALRKEMGWPQGLLHGNFNQTTARTGRLSSSKPNLQNFSSELQDIFVSRYP